MYECRLTIVNDGRSDSVIKIYPARIKEGKIWLNRVQHKEWWEKVKQNLHRYAEKGSFVPEPAPWHHDGNPLATITLTEDKIPQVRLDGWELPDLPKEDVMPSQANNSGNMLAVENRISSLEKNVGDLVNVVTKLLDSKEAPKSSTKSDALASSELPAFECCGRVFKPAGLAVHKRTKHKEG